MPNVSEPPLAGIDFIDPSGRKRLDRMVRTRLQRCTSCGEFGLGARCGECGSVMAAVSPMKYSPEDPQGARRRKRMDVGSDEWIDSLPTTRQEESEEE